MPEPFITVKMTKTALRLLRLIAADTDERQYEVLDRLLLEEAKRLGWNTSKSPVTRQDQPA